MKSPYVSLQWLVTWAIAAVGGTSTYDVKLIFGNIIRYNVTNLGVATPVLSLIANANQNPLPFKISIMTGGATPPRQVLLKIEELIGFNHHRLCFNDCIYNLTIPFSKNKSKECGSLPY